MFVFYRAGHCKWEARPSSNSPASRVPGGRSPNWTRVGRLRGRPRPAVLPRQAATRSKETDRSPRSCSVCINTARWPGLLRSSTAADLAGICRWRSKDFEAPPSPDRNSRRVAGSAQSSPDEAVGLIGHHRPRRCHSSRRYFFSTPKGGPVHPELLRALGKARHEDLLDERRSRRKPRVTLHDHSLRFARSRQRMGSLLIWAGARLIGDRGGAMELAHK